MGLMKDCTELIWIAGTEYAKKKGWIYASRFMSHALYGGGSELNFDDNSVLINTIKKSKVFKEHMESVKKSYEKNGYGLSGRDREIEFTVDDLPDLYYSLQHVTIDTTLLEDGTIRFSFTDLYDFTEYRSVTKLIINESVFSGYMPVEYYQDISKGDLANDVGTYALSQGIIQSFEIKCVGYYGKVGLSTQINKFVSIAEEQKGYVEGNNNNTPYGRWYGLNYEPWCAMFVSWCAAQAGILDTVVPRYCYCPSGVAIYQSSGRFRARWSGYIPKRGDVIFFQEGGESSHTGIVRSADNNIVNTVEGNAADAVRFRTYNLNDNYILGYGVSVSDGSFSSITTLRLGSKGESVRNLQNLLISRGYSCGASGADGDFGQGTYNAVIAFQKANGLDVDGIVGPATWGALNGTTSQNTATLRSGSKGESVRNLQNLLISKGYSCGASGADGDFGPGTYNAVIAFQKANGLDADGIVGPATWGALNGSINCNTLLRIGSKGEEVKRLQNTLISKGYSCGASGADGDFGQGTYNAVIAFQQDYGLAVDGIVGSATWAALSNTISTSSSILKIGSKGDNVRTLQNLLISKGYSCGSAGADGDFGQGTYNAVCKLQQNYGLAIDGIVGPATWNVLRNTSGTTSTLLRSGDKGEDVIQLQKILISKGYSCGSAGADGDFGQGTYNAVCKFQSEHGLDADGIVGPATWNALGLKYI